MKQKPATVHYAALETSSGFPIKRPETSGAPTPTSSAEAQVVTASLSDQASASSSTSSPFVAHHGTDLRLAADCLAAGPVTSAAAADDLIANPLRVRTDVTHHRQAIAVPTTATRPPRAVDENLRLSGSTSTLLVSTPSLKAGSVPSLASLSPPSILSSPALGPMVDITPLPSPIVSGDSPGPWTRKTSRPQSLEMPAAPNAGAAVVGINGESIATHLSTQQKRKTYQAGTVPSAVDRQASPTTATTPSTGLASHGRNRDVSEYIPDPVAARRVRAVTVSDSIGARSGAGLSSSDCAIQREPHVAAERGLTSPVVEPPTPPPSNVGPDSDQGSPMIAARLAGISADPAGELFEARGVKHQTRRVWRAIRLLGVGSFSRVLLASSQGTVTDASPAERARKMSVDEKELDGRQLVAIKVIEHGPVGGDDEERMDVALKRELDILRSTRHPSLVQLKAYSVEPTRALLVLNYCPGGDLYEVASQRNQSLTAPLIQRIFSELVAATAYLHSQLIVHRDIKLESEMIPTLRDRGHD